MNSNVKTILIGLGIGIAAFTLLGRSEKQKQEDAALGFTEDTGIIGALGATTNRASGGILARFGSFIARTLDPNEDKTLDELTGT